MGKILTAHILRMGFTTSQLASNCSARKGKDAAREQKELKSTIYKSTNLQEEENETEKSGYGVNWQQKSIWYISAKFDDRKCIRYSAKS